MKDTISLTLPLDAGPLKEASIMLGNMARGIDPGVFKKDEVTVTTVVGLHGKSETFTENTGLAPLEVVTITDPVVEEPNPTIFAEKVEGEFVTPPPPVEDAAPSDFIDTDARGMAWDKRIHASTKTKLANGNWKNKRGVHYQELEDVEAELTDQAALTPAPDTVAANTPVPTLAPAPEATATVSTFPELMAAITGNSMAPDAVLAAVKSVGLESLPLLAARPDLVPAVAKELGV